MFEDFCMILLGLAMLGALIIIGFTLMSMAESFAIWFNERLNGPKKPEPEPIRRAVVNGAVYLRQGDKVLDVGRGLRMSLQDGVLDEPIDGVSTWEGRRRVIASSPPVQMSVKVLRDALGAGDKGGPALPEPQIVSAGKKTETTVDL